MSSQYVEDGAGSKEGGGEEEGGGRGENVTVWLEEEEHKGSQNHLQRGREEGGRGEEGRRERVRGGEGSIMCTLTETSYSTWRGFRREKRKKRRQLMLAAIAR